MTENKYTNMYIDKLLQYPERFMQAFYQKRWSSAKYIYDSALRVAEFMGPDLPDDVKRQLFGGGEDSDTDIEPLFPMELVSKAYENCCIKLYQGYEHESYRRYGQPPQYYPQPRYPAPGYSK